MSCLSWSFTQATKRLSQRASLLYASKRLVWIIIGFGILLRFTQYLANRSLWLDEATVALDVVNLSFSEFLQPSLRYNCTTPLGFSILEKLAVQAFGRSEYVLRLFPLFSGMISLFLFYRVAKRSIKPKAVPIALGLFAISDPLIYYSSEVKAYSSDVAIALLLYSVTIYLQSKRLTTSRVALFGVLGAAAIWFSHSSVFVLAGVGASLSLFCLRRKEWARSGRLLIAYSLWASSFVTNYFIYLRNFSNSKSLVDFWSSSFMPFPPLSFSDAKWFVSTFFRIFENPVGLYLPGIAALTFLVGCISILLENKRTFFIIALPILFTLLASGFHKYPFKGRLLLFIVPSLLLFIAEGAQQIRDRTRHNWAIIGIALIGLLFFQPLLSVSYHLIKPRTSVGGYEIVEEIRPVIGYVREHQQDGDILYLHPGAWAAFKYYQQRYGYEDSGYIVGVSSQDN